MTLITVCSGTPIVRVRDNRGHVVRTLRYNRNEPGAVASQYVERNAFNALGQPASSQDARFFARGGGSPTLNFQHTPALSGQVLQTISADAGQTQTFYDIAGRRVWQRDARGTIQQFTYDALGRPLSRTETLDGQAAAVRERRVYGDTAAPAAPYDASDKTDPRNLNQRGHIIQHYDPAGLLDTREAGYTVLGAPQRQDRTLLPAEIPSDWTDAAVANWQATLAAKTATVYPTTWAYNAVGQALEQTDARGHRQRSAYDIAGRKSASWVTPQGQPEQTITTSIAYAAGGQIETRADANGVTTDYTYEPQNSQRMLTIKVARKPSGGAAAILQDLSYAYDPVGNVIGLNDGAQAPAYFKNRAVSAARAYTYDALYQLISASGRENAVATPSGTDSPQAFTPLNTATYRPYTRRYAYDLGGNLTQIVPGNSLPNRGMTVAAASNRAVSNANAQSVTAATVANYFDAAGNANCLDGNPTRPMRWSGLNQLGSLVTIQRSAQDQTQNDRESYAYGDDGQRVRKTAYAAAGGTLRQAADAIYLPGLELRASGNEVLEVIVLDDGARLLNWRTIPPAGINNQQVRYQYRERQGSCQIETDDTGAIITQEEYYPYGGTAVWAAASTSEAKYKTIRYSGKERDAAGLYYYGFRYYQPWTGRWINPDPAGVVDGLNLYCMVGNNPILRRDTSGLVGEDSDDEPPKKLVKLTSISEPTLPSHSTGSPFATIDPDLLDFLEDFDNLPKDKFEEKKEALSKLALETQEEDIGATHQEIIDGDYEFDEARRGHYKSKELSSAIWKHTFSGDQPNRYLRDGKYDAATEDISYIKSLALRQQTALEALPSRSMEKPPVKIYRAITTETTSEHPHTGLEAGDILISRDFLSFTENPYILTDFLEVSTVGERQEISPESAYFITTNSRSAKPVSPFAEDPEMEAEYLVPIGVAFQVESIGKVNHNGHQFTQVVINEVSGFHISDQRAQSDSGGPSPLNGKRVLKMGTGEPFDLSELRSRLGKHIDHVLRRYAPK